MAAMFVFAATSYALVVDSPHYDTTKGYSCASCHSSHPDLGATGYNNICINCHRPGGDPTGRNKPFTMADQADPFGSHSSTHATRIFQHSHRWDGSDTVPAAGAEPPTLAAMTTHNLRARTNGQLACVRCHNQHSNATPPFLRTSNSQDTLCLDCHRSWNSSTHQTGNHPLLVNYSAVAVSSPLLYAWPPRNANSSNSTSDLKARLSVSGGKLLCTTCHGVHYTDTHSGTVDGSANFYGLSTSRGLVLRTDLHGPAVAKTQEDRINICTNCHTGKKSHNFKNQNIQCADCHSAHVSYDPNDPTNTLGVNDYLVRRYMNVSTSAGAVRDKRVVLQGLSNTVRVYRNYTTGYGVCQACHTVPLSVGAHDKSKGNSAAYCNVCHKHDSLNGSFSGACNACHGYPPMADYAGGQDGYAAGYSRAMESDSKHARHAAGGSNYQYSCDQCHKGNVHIDGNFVQVFQDSNGTIAAIGGMTPSYASPTCTTVYCHSDGKGTATAPGWYDAGTLDCKGCHGGGGTAGEPIYANTGVGTPKANSHQKHINLTPTVADSCDICHTQTTTTGTSITGKQLHVNGAIDVTFNPSKAGSATYVSATKTCNAYCHSKGQSTTSFTESNSPNTTSVWGASLPVDCSGCHGNNRSAAVTINTKRHPSHINYTSAIGRYMGCAECHSATVSGDTTIADLAKHPNQKINIRFDNNINKNTDSPGYNGESTAAAGYEKEPGTTTGSCANLYCHSIGNLDADGNLVSAAGVGYRSIAWDGSTTIGCDGCHGGSSKAHPTYASGAAGSTTANSHVKHVEGSGLGCDLCHVNTTDDSAVPPTRVINGGEHLNRTESVSFKLNGGKTGTYNLPAKTCSATYCHGAGPSIPWGGSANCDSCHSATNSLAGRHDVHYKSTVIFWNITGATAHTGTAYAFGCKNCHPTDQHAKGAATVNRDADIAISGASRITAYAEAGATLTDRGFRYTQNGTCTTVCHSRDGAGAAPVTAVNWGSAATASCGVCHNKVGDAVPVWSAPHTKHINAYNANFKFTCNACHSGTASDNTTIDGSTGRNQHPNQVKNVAFNSWVGGTWSGTQCSNTYCHSNGTSTISPAHVAISWSSPPAITCSSCHDGSPNYTNGTPKANSHASHTGAYGCNYCHNSVTTTGNTITNPANHVNKQYDLIAGGGVTFTVTAETGTPTNPAVCNNISCHGNNSATWGAALYCINCHGSTTDLDDFAGTFWSDTTISTIKIAGEWDNTGHGRPEASLSYNSGNDPADFSAVARQCDYCHDPSIPHKQSNNPFRIWLANYSTVEWGRNGVCQVCHANGSLGMTVSGVLRNSTRKVDSRHLGSKHNIASNNGGQFCWDCHDPHGDGNDFMIHNAVALKSDPVTGAPTTQSATTFTLATPYSQTWGDFVKPANNGICQVCHTAGTVAHFNSTTYDTDHNTGTLCVACHQHSESTRNTAFTPIGDCNACHGYPPVRRGLPDGSYLSQGNYTSAKYEDYSGGGGAHSIEKHVPANAKASQGWGPCAVCHSNGSMNPSTHRMQTPIRPSDITIDIENSYKFDSRRQLGSERYSGKLTDGNDNQTGSCSNVKCHFKPAKKWSIER